MSYQKASIVLPLYEQADHLESIVRATEAGLNRLPIAHETILVLNGPDDGSLDIGKRLVGEFADLRLVSYRPAGWGRAVRRGLAEANGDLLCYTNSARTSIDTLLLMLECAIVLPGVVVKANRKTRDGVWRHMGSLAYNLECRALFNLSNFDINGTPKIFPRCFGRLMQLRSNGDLIDLEFLATCRQENHLVLEVPVVITRRNGGVSTTTIRSAAAMFAGAMLLRMEMRRAKRAADIR